MFAGRRRRSSNIRVMQLFHELKQQFPTVPDHVVSACIATHAHSNSPSKDTTIREILEAAAALNQQEPMGRSPPPSQEPPTLTHPSSRDSEEATATTSTERNEMNDSESDINRNVVKSTGVTFSKKYESVSVCTSQKTSQTTSTGKSTFFVKRPDKLDIRPDSDFPPRHTIQLSEKCKDVYKLLNSDNVSDKPPRSPSTYKRLSATPKGSPTRTQDARSPLASPETAKRLQEEGRRKETASTPTQTTDTLLGGNSVNVSLNVNCSMDVVQSPTRRRSVMQVTPEQPWLQEPSSPRSYTSVNLTLRPPSSEPQPPIDITSQNSSLTYSTSSFDSQKGLQSRLQITVGPGGGSVSATRTRPRSSYHPEGSVEEVVPYRAGSLNNLAAASEPPVILKQQARIERLKIELRTEKAKLEVMQNEVADLEGNRVKPIEYKIDAEVEKQLRREIKHLQYQCEQLALEADKNAPVDIQEDFYHNIYTGQRGPLNIEGGSRVRRLEGRYTQPPLSAFQDNEGPKWNCHLCTFLNHPDLDKCEQCEMPRILHVSAAPGDNIHIHVTPRLSRRVVHPWVL
ncbi:TGF-beta-activated kinase 1 and MAP3K7-binding protein 2 isoform X2 [Zophobas morio]|uniref:TGF-beta-activated kinase 1 and MAP3K7-binding protein 2 isoform X2 n=1 Tax=Zophobas morio TaxID=2755281 RepID=UPI0030838A7E